MTARVLTATMTQPRRASVDQGRTVYSVVRILLGVAAALTCRLLAEAAPMNPEPTSAQLKTAAGKIASLAGAPPATKSTKVGKLRKKDGHRLPRRQKKAQQKTPASRKT